MDESDASAVAVVGGANATTRVAEMAATVGREIAERGGVLLCGGRGGVMEHAARGAREAGGSTIGILPGRPGDPAANPYLTFRIYTGLGQARNQVIVLSASALIAIGGEWGTLSEIALALKYRVPVVLLDSFGIEKPDGDPDPLLFQATTAAEAVATAFERGRRL